jgi:hypothetical protein
VHTTYHSRYLDTLYIEYIQFKWRMRQQQRASEDSDDSEEETLMPMRVEKRPAHYQSDGWLRKKNHHFSSNKVDEIEYMINEGNASRSQMMQLRRQLQEAKTDMKMARHKNSNEASDDERDSDSSSMCDSVESRAIKPKSYHVRGKVVSGLV